MATNFGNDRLSTRARSRLTISPGLLGKGAPGKLLFRLFITIALVLVGLIVGLLFKYNFWAGETKVIQYDSKKYNVLSIYEGKSPNPVVFRELNKTDGVFTQPKIPSMPSVDDKTQNDNGQDPSLKQQNGSECQFSKDYSRYQLIRQLNRIKVWPMPHSIDLYDYDVPIQLPMTFQTNFKHEILHEAVKRYQDIMFSHTVSSEPRVYHEYFDGVVLHIDKDDDVELELSMDESYELIVPALPSNSVNCNKILLRAGTVFGALRGLETLSQLIRYDFATDTYKIMLASINDKPRFAHRGILLDTSRHFHPPTVIKHLLDAMSYAKFNVFHWHVVDEESFPYQSNAFPNLWNGSYSIHERYSEKDIFEIIDYARFRGIRVIPEFDTPGHAGSWCKGYPEICIRASCRRPSPTLLDPSNPLTFEIVEGVLKEASQRFPDQFLHLG
ncbi:hypothetical protein RFI_28611 [Reticulomyxa filosa]|uniref:beta-N-acetylhexosaminidase n=1 Tax=Reticulomyxa filosa TaxID=46433 RepID=X6M4C3_RETFI|nr:hypothetical protein RFI_28611 [Reticulomyxa filosa]|eukprot:ETO08779.1 hypothetical protein RFI_28611 [Reticulomyxa filosa]